MIASTLRDKMQVTAAQFRAYFLALLADKEFTHIIETVSKVDKSFNRSKPYSRTTQASGNRPLTEPTATRVVCYRCGTPGHKSPQCWKRPTTNRQPSRRDRQYNQHL